MARLTKAQEKAHLEAIDLLRQDRLSLDEREFVIENWRDSATQMNAGNGAFFTPLDLARDMMTELPRCGRLIDVCAGIGTLSYAVARHAAIEGLPTMVCVEINPEYAAVGRKVVPEATWIVADIFDLSKHDPGCFDVAIGNPPFGAVTRSGNAPRYRGRQFEYHMLDLVSDIADYGIFILPQASVPFRYSGQSSFETIADGVSDSLYKQTRIRLEMNCGLDMSVHAKNWRDTTPNVEIALCDFKDARASRELDRLGVIPKAMFMP